MSREGRGSTLSLIVAPAVNTLLYKPPLGVVTASVIIRWWQGRDKVISGHAAVPEKPREVLDETDADDYVIFGGVDHVRRLLVLSALKWHSKNSTFQPDEHSLQLKEQEDTTPKATGSSGRRAQRLQREVDRNLQPVLEAAIDALELNQDMSSATPDHVSFLKSLMEKWTKFEALWNHQEMPNELSASDVVELGIQEKLELMNEAGFCLQIRLMDALLRTYRNSVVQVCFRLEANYSALQQRIQKWTNPPTVVDSISSWLRRLVHSYLGNEASIECDRLRLTTLKASYRAELTRLGAVQKLLMERPSDLPGSCLAEATVIDGEVSAAFPVSSITANILNLVRQQQWWDVYEAIRDIGYQFIGAAVTFVTPSELSGKLANSILAKEETTDQEVMEAWLQKGKKLFSSSISSTIKNSSRNLPKKQSQMWFSFQRLLERWHGTESVFSTKDWLAVLSYSNSHREWTRKGESPLSPVTEWSNYLVHNTRENINGLPAIMLQLYMANYIGHTVAERLPQLKSISRELACKSREIVKDRVLIPVKGIYDDLLSKNPGIFSTLGLQLEEQSLDHMLQDMAMGDGTSSTRANALELATQEYEDAVRGSLLWNAAQGKLAKLLLLQVQQLKVGLLSALDTIDVLLQGNRIHLQLLAIVPAVFVATFGARFAVRCLNNIRTRNVRSIRSVHLEMTEHIAEIRRLCIDQNGQRDGTLLSPTEVVVGSVILVVFKYLKRLENCRTPFSTRRCNEMQREMNGLVDAICKAHPVHSVLARIDAADKRHARMFT